MNTTGHKRRLLEEGEALDLCLRKLYPDFARLLGKWYREATRTGEQGVSFKKRSLARLVESTKNTKEDIAHAVELKLQKLVTRETELFAMANRSMFQEAELSSIARKRQALIRGRDRDFVQYDEQLNELAQKKRERERLRKRQKRLQRGPYDDLTLQQQFAVELSNPSHTPKQRALESVEAELDEFGASLLEEEKSAEVADSDIDMSAPNYSLRMLDTVVNMTARNTLPMLLVFSSFSLCGGVVVTCRHECNGCSSCS